MRLATIVLYVLAAALGTFGWWGTQTAAGRRHYDEMAGMIPLFAGLAGGVLLVGGLSLTIWQLTHRPAD
jgi:hypothetical protein